MAGLTAADLSILLIEPSSTQLKLIMRHLEEEHIKYIDTAGSAEQALEKIQKYMPDLIISSLYLPDMSADQLIVVLHEQYNDPAIPFMLISSETGNKALEPIRQAGVMAILPKPFDHVDLQRAIRASLDVIDPEEIALQNYDVSELHVLLVDDSLTSRNHLSRVLSSMGIARIDTAENGREAVDYLASNHYDLIVTDLNMPEMDGHQLVEHVRQSGDTLTPILMATSENNQSRLDNVEQAGVSAFLDKPFEPQLVREMLYRLLG